MNQTTITAVDIRRAQRGDASVLTGIAHAAKRHWGYGDDLIELWRDDLTLTPETIAANPVYVAIDGARAAGFYALSHEDDVFELEHMWVDPPHMGTGIGRQLFEHAAMTARALGGSVLKIASDPNAEGFYLAQGAHRAGSVVSTPPGRLLPLLFLDLEARDARHRPDMRPQQRP